MTTEQSIKVALHTTSVSSSSNTLNNGRLYGGSIYTNGSATPPGIPPALPGLTSIPPIPPAFNVNKWVPFQYDAIMDTYTIDGVTIPTSDLRVLLRDWDTKRRTPPAFASEQEAQEWLDSR